MQEFYINKGSLLPTLRIELIDDGRHDFNKFHDSIQNATVTFTMTDVDTGFIKIANAPAIIQPRETNGCIEQYIICYEWKERDVKKAGTFKGQFNINFLTDLTSEDKVYPYGNLIVPIREELIIFIM